MKPGAQIDVAGTPVTVLSGHGWILPDGTVVRCRPDKWGVPVFVIDDDIGTSLVHTPRIVAGSLHEAVTRHQSPPTKGPQ